MKNNIEIITTGDEILSGITQDTNFSWLSNIIFETGSKVRYKQCIGDNLEDILKALNLASLRSNIVIFTGGLGPTDDDLTRLAASKFFDKKLKLNKKSEEKIKKIFFNRKRKYSFTNKKQAMFPNESKIIVNPFGTADGFMMTKESSKFYFLPGVPKELKAMISKYVLKDIKKSIRDSKKFMSYKMIKVYGLPESEVAEKLIGINKKNTDIGYRPSNFEIHLRVLANGTSKKESDKKLNIVCDKIKKRLNEYIFSYDQEETLFQVVFDILLKKRMKISFAESCTGGMISNELTNISGSSKVYGFGLNTYSNSAKTKILNVSDSLLKKYGAVSREVVRVMVKNLIKLSKSDIGIAVSGIAGPSGGSKNKPVGTVFVAYYLNNKIITRKYFFTGTRKSIKLRTTLEVYDFIRKNLL